MNSEITFRTCAFEIKTNQSCGEHKCDAAEVPKWCQLGVAGGHTWTFARRFLLQLSGTRSWHQWRTSTILMEPLKVLRFSLETKVGFHAQTKGKFMKDSFWTILGWFRTNSSRNLWIFPAQIICIHQLTCSKKWGLGFIGKNEINDRGRRGQPSFRYGKYYSLFKLIFPKFCVFSNIWYLEISTSKNKDLENYQVEISKYQNFQKTQKSILCRKYFLEILFWTTNNIFLTEEGINFALTYSNLIGTSDGKNNSSRGYNRSGVVL